MSPKIIDKSERRREILLAAMKEVALKGFKNVRIDHIAAAAGVGKGTVYEYFTSKDEIFGAAVKELMAQMEDAQAKKMFRATTPPEKIKAILDAWVEVSEQENNEYMQLMMDFWAEGIRESVYDTHKIIDMKSIYDDYTKIVAAIITDGINLGIFKKTDARLVAGIFLASVDGLLIQWLIDPKNRNLKKSADLLYEIFIKGISNE